MRDTPNTTSLLIEYGFIDNPSDVYKLQNNLTDYAEAVVKAVSNYIGIPYKLPGGVEVPSNTYIVKRGDSLYSIARMYNTTVAELRLLNDLTSDILSIGQILFLPTTSQDNNDLNTSTYTVTLGDNLYSIADKFNVSVVDLINLNNLSSTVLVPGQVLNIPNGNTINTTYIVKKGDTLYGIASSYGVTVDDIKILNNLDSNDIYINQELLIPSDKTITETNYEVYTVQSGDTLYKIANTYGVTVNDIINVNNLNNTNLSIGQRLQIPLKEVTSSNFVYTVKKGDTLYGIASNFGLTVLDIMELNNLDSTTLIVGQELFIPQK